MAEKNKKPASAEEELDKDLAEATEANKGHIEPDPGEEKPEEKDEGDDSEEDDDSDEEEEEETEDGEKPDEKKKPKEKSKPKEGEDEGEDEDGDDAEDEEDDEEDKDKDKPPERPAKYIPLDKYQDEKKSWREEKEALEEKIKNLTELVGGEGGEKPKVPKEGSPDEAKVVEAYAKEHSVTEESVKGFLKLIRDFGIGTIPKDQQEKIDLATKMVERNKDDEFFGKQFDDEVMPLIKEQFPEASEEAIAEVRARLDTLGHTQKLHKTPLEYIFNGHLKEFSKTLGGGDGEEVKGKGKTSEKSKTGAGKATQISAKDFKPDKDGNIDFSSLDDLDPKEKNKIISDLEPEIYMKYVDYVESQDGTEVRRGGRAVKLK